MTKKQIDQQFKDYLLPSVKKAFERDNRATLKGKACKDKPARCEAYNNYIDSLHREGRITESQANRYCIPKSLIN